MVAPKPFAFFGWCIFGLIFFPARPVKADAPVEVVSQSAEPQEENGAVDQARQELDARRVQSREATWAIYFLVFLAVMAPLLALMFRVFLMSGQRPYVLDSAAALEKARSHREDSVSDS